MIWKALGFERDLFFVTPLKPVASDIDLFYGRSDEIKSFMLDVLSGERALKVISGRIGLGKTSFVNACQYYSFAGKVPYYTELTIKKLLPCYEKIQVAETDSPTDLYIKVLKAIAHSIKTYAEQISKPISDKEVQRLVDLFNAALISSGKGGATIGGGYLGIAASVGVNTPSVAINQFMNHRDVIRQLVKFVQAEYHFEGIFVVINNLDIVPKTRIIELFNQARDNLFDLDDVYWIAIGHEGLGSMLTSEVERVSDYISGKETKIRPLDSDEIIKIVQKRANVLKMKNNAICPLSDKSIETIHEMSLNEIRNTFKVCSEIVVKAFKQNESLTQIPHEKAIGLFIEFAQETAETVNMTENNKKILSGVFSRKECRPRDFADFGYQTPAGFIAALQALVKKQLLNVIQVGKASIYTPTGMTIIAGVTGALGPEIEAIAKEKLEKAEKGEYRINKFKEKEERPQMLLFGEDEE